MSHASINKMATGTTAIGNAIVWAAVLVVIGYWLNRSQEIDVAYPIVRAPTISCLSYAPFRRAGASPFLAGQVVPVGQIEEDLRLIKKYSQCVRTYGVSQGLENVPAIAQKLGMQVKLGAWISRDVTANQVELNTAISLAQRYTGTVDTLIVGNEVLLRKELSVSQLALLLNSARIKSPVPVAYADVWEFWLQNAQLAQHVDIVGVHILPYWEDYPVGIQNAAEHVFSIAKKVQKVFPGKALWVGETGWPSAGRQRGAAQPGVIEQSSFIRQMLIRLAEQKDSEKLTINFIEAFDQPWKKALEGAMGGYWGMLDADGKAKFSFAGGVVEDKLWPGPAMMAMAVAAVLGLLFGTFIRGRDKSSRKNGWPLSLFIAGCASVSVGMLAATTQFAQIWNRTVLEWVVWGVSVVCVALYSWGLLRRSLACQPTAAGGVSAYGVAADNSVGESDLQASASWPLIQTLGLFVVAMQLLLLAFDARYRGFNTALIALPALFSLLHVLMNIAALSARPAISGVVTHSRDYFLLAVIALCGIGVLFQEGFANTQALLFVAATELLVACLLASSKLFDSSSRGISNSATPDSKSAGAARSAQ